MLTTFNRQNKSLTVIELAKKYDKEIKELKSINYDLRVSDDKRQEALDLARKNMYKLKHGKQTAFRQAKLEVYEEMVEVLK